MQRKGNAPQPTNGALLGEAVPPQSATLAGTALPAPYATVTLQATDAPAQDSATPAPTAARRIAASAGASIEARLVAAQIAIATVLGDPDLQAIMAGYGYDAERMHEGQVLHTQAAALYHHQRAGFGEKLAATDALASAHAQAHAVYMRHVAIARVALRGDRGAAQTLGVATARKRTQAGWLLQAQQFYANALGNRAIEQKLAAFGTTPAQLADAQRLVAAVVATLTAQQTSKDAAATLTHDRDKALAALRRWMRDFRAIARVALADQPR